MIVLSANLSGASSFCSESCMRQKLVPGSGRCCNKNLHYEAVALEPEGLGRLRKMAQKIVKKAREVFRKIYRRLENGGLYYADTKCSAKQSSMATSKIGNVSNEL